MDQIREQMDISNEISDAISNPVNMGIDVDDVSYLARSHGVWTLTLIPLCRSGGAQERARRVGTGAAQRPSHGCRAGSCALPGTSDARRAQRT